jgi:hypothetical protein
MDKEEQTCACGKPLHYPNENTKYVMDCLIERYGTHIRVEYGDKTYWVSRHYIALHGIVGSELPKLYEQGIIGLAP